MTIEPLTTGARQLLAFRFGTESRFEGQLVGALERIESGGTVRVLDGLFVAREPGSGELSAIALGDSASSRMTSRLLGFRLDAADRRAATQRALDGEAGEAVRSLAAMTPPLPGSSTSRRQWSFQRCTRTTTSPPLPAPLWRTPLVTS